MVDNLFLKNNLLKFGVQRNVSFSLAKWNIGYEEN